MQNSLGAGRGHRYNNNVNMEYIYTTKIVKIGDSKGVIIPLPILDGLGWKRGDMVVFTFAAGDQLIIKKLDDETIRQIKRQGNLGDEPTIQI